jgi:hypothetical protein
VIPAALSQQAFEALSALGCSATLDRLPRLGHVLDDRVVECVLHRLRAFTAQSI